MVNRFESFTILLANINRSIRKIKALEIEKFDLKGPHVSVIYFLRKNGELTSKELCDLCDEDKANISRTLEYLESKGYIACTTQGTKRYRSPMRLTEEGSRIGDYINNKVDEVLNFASEGVSDEERAILYKCLERININLLNVLKEYKD